MWEAFQQQYPVGTEVEGKITHKRPFGVFIDIGEPFIVLLEIPSMKDLDYPQYLDHQQFNVGETVRGTVTDFTSGNQMRITQKSKKG